MEILSPAGNYEQGIAAIHAGANAVYGGLKKWNARTRATNFTFEEYFSFINLCHSCNVKFYLTINSLLTDKEIDEIIDVLCDDKFILPDAIIITDIGLITKIKHKNIPVPLHISTQQGVSNVEEALFFQNLGAERVVLARELSLDTIKEIKKYTSIELEVFVYGAQCVSYSGYCYWGYLANKGSGNRGSCSGPCRMFYKSNHSDTTTPFYADYMDNLNYLMILSGIGIDSIKIEGRLRKSEEISNQIINIKNVLNGLEQINPIYSPGFLSGQSKIRFKNHQANTTTIGGISTNNELIITVRIQDNNCIVEICYHPYGIIERINLSDSNKKENITIAEMYDMSCDIFRNKQILFRIEKVNPNSILLIDKYQFEQFLKSIAKRIGDYNQLILFNSEWLSNSFCQIDNIDAFHYLYDKGVRAFIIDITSEHIIEYFLGLNLPDTTCIYKLPLLDCNNHLYDVLLKLKNCNIMLAKISQLQIVESFNWTKNKVYFDYTCNIFNKSTSQFLVSKGYTNFTASIEQNYDMLSTLFDNSSTLQYVVGGRLPVGVSIFPLDDSISFVNIMYGYAVHVNFNSLWKTYSIYADLLCVSAATDSIRNKRFVFSGMKIHEVRNFIENGNQEITTSLRMLYE